MRGPISSRGSSWDKLQYQAAVDNKYNLVVATHTINRNDLNAQELSLSKKENLG
jgi:hypothetical protein